MLRITNYHLYFLFIAYIIGLLSTSIPLDSLDLNYLAQGIIFTTIVIGVSLFTSIIVNHYFSQRIDKVWWLIAALVVISSFYYGHWSFPTPNPTDVIHQLEKIDQPLRTNVSLTGKVITTPKINRNHRAKFELQALEFQETSKPSISVTGKVYITAPLLMTTGLYPSQIITLTGKLYQPQRQLNPGSFDFSNYLALKGTFSGFIADKIKIVSEGSSWARLMFQLRHRVIKTHVRYLNTEMGTLVSSITIGSRVVDLPYHLLDSFRQIGLAHVISASGFHVSLLLMAILALTQGNSPQVKLIVGLTGLLVYLSLTGFYPSVLRASLMGVGVLIGIISDRQVKVAASLLLVATILLIINPLWIWDLGFQFSFLATWGLISTLPALVKRLDWLPPNLASLIAVPLAATIWILPLQCYVFNGFSPYSILINIVTTPLVIIISLGGMITGLIGICFPLIGSYLAILLIPFAWCLVNLVQWTIQLPFSYFAVGKVPLISLLICYGVLILINHSIWWQKRWLKISLFVLALLIIPLAYQKLNLVQITIMATNPQPVIVIQNHQKFGVINLNNKNTLNYTVIPFLNSQGINQLNFVWYNHQLNSSLTSNYLSSRITIKQMIGHSNNQELNNFEQLKLTSINPELDILKLEFNHLDWLIINTKKNVKLSEDLQTDVLIYSGNNLSLAQLRQLKPKIVIVFGYSFSPQQRQYLIDNQVQVFVTQQDGAIQWRPQTGFRAYDTNYDTIY